MPSRIVVSVPLSEKELAKLEAARKTSFGFLSKAEIMRQALFELIESREGYANAGPDEAVQGLRSDKAAGRVPPEPYL